MAEPTFREPILHVDMDAFFVEVERLTDPTLVGVPVVVGSDASRGVVASASYEAREFGVRSAMPMEMAKRMCDGLRIIPASHGRYSEVSAEIFRVFRSYTPLVQSLSVDEAFLDVTGLRRHYIDSQAVATAIREELRAVLALPASVGIATTMYLAKLASQRAKPDGVFTVGAGTETQFLAALDVGQLWGVGEATRASLDQLGVETVGDLARTPLDTLRRRVGDSVGSHLHRLANGIDDRVVTPDSAAKSLSAEETYASDITGEPAVNGELLRLSDRLAWRLRRAGVAGSTVTVKIRFADFRTITRSHTLESATDVTRDIYHEARRLVSAATIGDAQVRLLGIGMSELSKAGGTRQLAIDREARWDELADAVDDVRTRFGREAVAPVSLHESRTAGATVNETLDVPYTEGE